MDVHRYIHKAPTGAKKCIFAGSPFFKTKGTPTQCLYCTGLESKLISSEMLTMFCFFYKYLQESAQNQGNLKSVEDVKSFWEDQSLQPPPPPPHKKA